MLYVYGVGEYFRWNKLKTEEEMFAIENCKDLKPIFKDDCYDYIGKEKSFITDDDREIFADYTLSEFITRNFDIMESEIEIPYINKVSFSDYYAKECLREALQMGEYTDRIFNSENPYVEIYNIINEEMIDLLKRAAELFKKEVDDLDYIIFK